MTVAPEIPLNGTAPKTLWRMATEYPRSNISGEGLTTFARLAAARTNGAVTVEPVFDNELKIPSSEMIQAARERRVTGGDAFAGALAASDPVFGLASLPFAIRSIEVARAVNGKARPLYEKAMAARGQKLLYMTIWPPTGLWSNQPLRVAGDLRGLSVRTYDENSTNVMRAAGATAAYIPFNDGIVKVRDHEINAVLSSGDGGAGKRLWDYLPYFAPLDYAIPVSLAFIRASAFEDLADAVQAQIIQASAETEQSQLALLAHRTAENYARMRANGVTITAPVPIDILAALRGSAAGPMASWKAKVPAEAAEILDWAIRQ